MIFEYLISEKYRDLLKKSEEVNKEEILTWSLPNLLYPVAVIAISWLCFFLFKDTKNKVVEAFINLLINGSLPMVALNRFSSFGVNIFKFDANKEKQNSSNTYSLRLVIVYYSLGLIVIISAFYIYQVLNYPFAHISFLHIIQIFFTIFLIIESLKISKCAFLLQEKLMDSTFASDIFKEIEEKGHSNNWDK